MTDGLSCECLMPLAWQAVQLEPNTHLNLMQESALLLTALNHIEAAHEHESAGPENRRLDRIEAKLDLTLHLLARTLEADTAPPARILHLTPTGAQWHDLAPPADGTALILELRPSDALPLSLKLPAIAIEAQSDKARVKFTGLTEALDEALYQFVFRRHRQAIRARSTPHGPAE